MKKITCLISCSDAAKGKLKQSKTLMPDHFSRMNTNNQTIDVSLLHYAHIIKMLTSEVIFINRFEQLSMKFTINVHRTACRSQIAIYNNIIFKNVQEKSKRSHHTYTIECETVTAYVHTLPHTERPQNGNKIIHFCKCNNLMNVSFMS